LAADIAATKEAHHFTRFPEHSYSVSFVALVLLDSVTLIRSVSSNQENAIKELHTLDQL
jgi:hypothetical protein